MKRLLGLSAVIIVSLLSLLGLNTASAQYYYQMKVRTLDGLITPFDVNHIDSVYFELAVLDDSGNDENETTVTGNATDITTYTATITSWANILDNLSTDIKVGIIYSTDGTPSKNNGTQVQVSTTSLGSDAKYTITITDLAPATTYYYRSFVYQSGIWFYGNVKEFTTKGQGVNLVSGEVTKLTCYSAKVSGAISVDETTQYRTITYGICYSTDGEPTVFKNKVQVDNILEQDGNFSCLLRALSGSTTYYYRSFAIVDGYINYGPIRSFTTKDDDVVITGDIDSTYTVKSTLKIGGGAYSSLLLGVCYGINETPSINDRKVTINEVDDEGNFTISLTDIPYGTVYYRSFVMIDNVAHYGEIKHFEYNLFNGIAAFFPSAYARKTVTAWYSYADKISESGYDLKYVASIYFFDDYTYVATNNILLSGPDGEYPQRTVAASGAYKILEGNLTTGKVKIIMSETESVTVEIKDGKFEIEDVEAGGKTVYSKQDNTKVPEPSEPTEEHNQGGGSQGGDNEDEQGPAFFPTTYADKTVVAWYSYTESEPAETRVEAVFLFDDNTLIVTEHKIFEQSLQMPDERYIWAVGSFQLSGNYDNGTANVILDPERKISVYINNGVLAIEGFNYAYIKRDLKDLPEPLEPDN